MKKILFMLLCAAFAFQSCSKEEYKPQEVEFTIDYSFSSGSMTKATNDEIYTQFFNDYIKTRKITPKHYLVTFTNIATTQKTEIAGLWTEKSLIKLLEGEYTVSGTSINKSGVYKYVRDSVALSFEDKIKIDTKTSSISIKAGYNCSLILFGTSNTTNVRYYNSQYGNNIDETLKELNGYYYGFVNSFFGNEAYLEITRKNGKIIKVYTKDLKLENGKYYFFNDVTSSFDLEPMTPGN